MGVIFIGDRGVGKSHLIKKLINRQSGRIRITNLTEEQLELYPSFFRSGDTVPTQSIDTRTLEMRVRLLAPVKLSVDWNERTSFVLMFNNSAKDLAL
jgi:GTPase SAR1 family protein